MSAAAARRREITWEDPVEVAAAGADLSGLEYMSAVASGKLPPPPIAGLMRMRPVEVEPGRAVFEGHPGEEHYNPIGVVHGGYAATVLDSALGCAVHTTLEPGAGYTTVALEVKMVRPITRDIGRVEAEGEVLYRGRRQATAQARLIDPATGNLLAHATATCLIIWAE